MSDPIEYRGTTAVVTGASSGLGAEFARSLAARGADVVLVARREERLRALAAEIEKDSGVAATAIALDLTRSDAASRLRADLEDRGIRPATLINNAGFGLHGPFVDSDPDATAQLIQLNVTAVVELTRALLPQLLTGRGALVNVASSMAYQAGPGMAVYGASKAFVLSFTEAVGHEVRDRDLRVLAVSPGATRTEFFDVVGERFDAPIREMTVGQVVEATLSRLDHSSPPPSFVPGWRNALNAKLAGIVPRRVAIAVSARTIARGERGDRPPVSAGDDATRDRRG
ncbi:SDR family oxidoreductase [Microbacterium awajiense]|uniref:SDR family oxidoreductase n=1 Tax=Microbacterium awajiense TaxID=415214 RepID=A0ABP7A2T4_9MICO